MEVKVNHISFELRCYLSAVEYFETQKPKESIVVFFGDRNIDPFRPGWSSYEIEDVLIPEDSDYLVQTSGYLRMAPGFHERIKAFSRDSGLEPLIFDHCQPIDVPSGTDAATTRKVSKYYAGSVMGSFNVFHRFFRPTHDRFEMVSWAVEDGTYHRQKLAIEGATLALPQHRRIASAKILIVGVGGIGWKIAIDLAMMGVGRIDLVDPDRVEQSNLSRIPLTRSSVGNRKVEELRRVLQTIRPNLIATAKAIKIQQLEPEEFGAYDVVVVATDNLQSRLYCNDACLEQRVPCIQIGASLEGGMKSISCRTVLAGFTPCYECWKTFTVEELRRDFYTEEQKQFIQKMNYGLPSPVPSITYVNSIASGIAEEALLRLLLATDVIPYVYIDLSQMTMKTYSQQRDQKCRACSNIPDCDVAWLSAWPSSEQQVD
jgi:molybdopterin/thiamine biosynthesis adenylyltransferase